MNFFNIEISEELKAAVKPKEIKDEFKLIYAPTDKPAIGIIK